MILENNGVKPLRRITQTIKNWKEEDAAPRRFEKHPANIFTTNQLLAAQNEEFIGEVLPFLERISFSGNENLYQPNDKIDFLYFPETAVISEFQILEDGRTLEIAMTGREGVSGLLSVLNSQRAANWTQVSVGGSAFRISQHILKHKLAQFNLSQNLLFSYLNSYIGQISQRAVCNNYHLAGQRFCSWLLMVQNRRKSDKLPLTQEQIARFLGLHRPSVTHIAQSLRIKKIINYVRGNIYILNRTGLEQNACGCHLEIDKDSAVFFNTL